MIRTDQQHSIDIQDSSRSSIQSENDFSRLKKRRNLPNKKLSYECSECRKYEEGTCGVKLYCGFKVGCGRKFCSDHFSSTKLPWYNCGDCSQRAYKPRTCEQCYWKVFWACYFQKVLIPLIIAIPLIYATSSIWIELFHR